jgi:hypothetical protein
LLNSGLAVSIQEAVQGVCAPDGDGLGGGQEGVPSSSGQCQSPHEAWEGEDAAVVSNIFKPVGISAHGAHCPPCPGGAPYMGCRGSVGGGCICTSCSLHSSCALNILSSLYKWRDNKVGSDNF